MKTKDIFETIEAMYSNKPFKAENGELVFVPDPLDRLINACELIETLLYNSAGLSTYSYEQFLKMTYDFILSISPDVFKLKAENLEHNTKDILLRNLDKLVLEFSDDTVIPQYSAILKYGEY